MALETNTDVEQVNSVQDGDGNRAKPANEQGQLSIWDTLKTIRDYLGNRAGVNTGTYSTGSTSAEQLPSESIPDGIEVAIQASNGNAGAVFVGDSNAQPIRLAPNESVSLSISDLSAVYVQTPNSGDGVGYVYEG